MSTYIYGIFYTILFVILCKMFLERFERKRNFKSNIYGYEVIIFLIVLIYIVSVFFADNFVLKEIFVLLLSALFMWIYFRQKFIKVLVLVLLYQGIALVIDYVTIIVVAKCFPSITMERLSDPVINILLGVLSQTLLFCLIMFMSRYIVQKSSVILTTMEWVRFSVFPIFTIVVLVALLTGFEIPQNSSQKSILICVLFGLLIMNIVVFYLINDVLRREMQIRENHIILERVRNETENYDRQRKREHEYKNQIAVITVLANDNKVEELKDYLKSYNNEIIGNLDLIDTNNVIVNAIINSKYQEARRKGIAFVLKVNDLSDLKMKDEDIVLILSNLLNNAIEACEKCKEAIIKLKFVREINQTIISVVNTLSEEPMIVNNKFVTSKSANPEMHGIGIENVKETVEKYGGSSVIKYDNSSFKFVIHIPE